MFKIKKYNTIAENSGQYLSFPDIIRSEKNKNKFFLVYRSGDNHHPSYSSIHFLISYDKCKTWDEFHTFQMNMREDGKVWNCPRLSYLPNGNLCIICDTKTSKDETIAKFKIYFIISLDDGFSFSKTSSNKYMGVLPTNIGLINENYVKETEMYGMVPDKIVKFKDNLYCANHIRDHENKTLTQMVNCSKDGGKTWFDCSILARIPGKNAFCEASLINYKDKFLIAYVRDNYNPPLKMHKFMSKNGTNWTHKGTVPIYGHRATAMLYNNKLLIGFRNTKNPGISLATAILDSHGKEKDIEQFEIDTDTHLNMFHCGYTGLTKCDTDTYCISYYIKKNKKNPYIKTCTFKYS